LPDLRHAVGRPRAGGQAADHAADDSLGRLRAGVRQGVRIGRSGRARKTAAAGPRLLDLFETFEAGKPEARKPERRKASKPVEIAPAWARPARSFDSLKPTYTSFFETAEGELVHAILARFIELPKDLQSALEAAYEDLAPGFPFKFDKPKVIKSLLAFLGSPGVAPLFAAAAGRQVLVEAEFIDKTGSLFRMDRVLVDKGAITVIDFKTGGENTEKYTAQLKNYLNIISEIYGKTAKGQLAYVDLVKVATL